MIVPDKFHGDVCRGFIGRVFEPTSEEVHHFMLVLSQSRSEPFDWIRFLEVIRCYLGMVAK